MDDKTIDDTAEYKFDDSEGSGYVATSAISEFSPEIQLQDQNVEEMPSATPKLNLDKVKLRKIAVPAGIVVAILSLYIVFTFMSSRKTSSFEQEKMMMQDNATAVQNQSSMQQATPSTTLASPVSYTPQAPALETSDSPDDAAKIANIVQQQMNSIRQQTSNYANRISNIDELQKQTQQDLMAIAQQVEQITAAIQHVLTEQQNIKKAIAPKPKKKVAVMPESYHVRAIVPGRVWLESEKGKSVSLRVGSKLDGYGEVEVISPRQGMVVMSNGSVIQYDADDI